MATSQKITGKAKLTLKLGTPAVDHYADITSYTLTNEEADSDVITFADVENGGGRQELLNLTAIQSLATGSFWRMVWEKTGTDAAFTLAPYGNATPTANQPHIVGTVTIGPRPDLGGEAGASNTFTFDTSWKLVGSSSMLVA
jgi:hypothetical protein